MSNQNQKQWSDELNQEVSSIKPELGTGQKEKKEPRFTYSTADTDSYVKNGFGVPLLQDRPDKMEVQSLISDTLNYRSEFLCKS